MTRMMYNWIMRRKLKPREDPNRRVSNFTGRIKGMHVFVGKFTYVVNFMIVEDISSIIDPRLSQVVLGKPFIEISNMTHDLSLGVVRFTGGINEIAYKMPYKIECGMGVGGMDIFGGAFNSGAGGFTSGMNLAAGVAAVMGGIKGVIGGGGVGARSLGGGSGDGLRACRTCGWAIEAGFQRGVEAAVIAGEAGVLCEYVKPYIVELAELVGVGWGEAGNVSGGEATESSCLDSQAGGSSGANTGTVCLPGGGTGSTGLGDGTQGGEVHTLLWADIVDRKLSVAMTAHCEQDRIVVLLQIEQYDSLSDLEKEHTHSVYLRNEEDKRRGVEYVMNKMLGFYKECLELGPEYLTGVADEEGVT
ncbi:hypothetical protein Tco_0412936 [Tanacetum coccineum]